MEGKNQFFLKDLEEGRSYYKTGINCQLDDLSATLGHLTKKLNDIAFSAAAKDLSDEIVKILSKQNKARANRLEKLKSTLGKYWEVKKYADDKRKEVSNTRLIFAYDILTINDTYWFVEGIVDDDYNSGMRSSSCDIYDSFANCQFIEITKEEFIRRVNEHVNEVLDIRLRKINERQGHNND